MSFLITHIYGISTISHEVQTAFNSAIERLQMQRMLIQTESWQIIANTVVDQFITQVLK